MYLSLTPSENEAMFDSTGNPLNLLLSLNDFVYYRSISDIQRIVLKMQKYLVDKTEYDSRDANLSDCVPLFARHTAEYLEELYRKNFRKSLISHPEFLLYPALQIYEQSLKDEKRAASIRQLLSEHRVIV